MDANQQQQQSAGGSGQEDYLDKGPWFIPNLMMLVIHIYTPYP